MQIYLFSAGNVFRWISHLISKTYVIGWLSRDVLHILWIAASTILQCSRHLLPQKAACDSGFCHTTLGTQTKNFGPHVCWNLTVSLYAGTLLQLHSPILRYLGCFSYTTVSEGQCVHILRHSDKTVYGTTWQYLAGTVSCGNNRIPKHTTLNAYTLLEAKIPRHQELKSGVQQRNTDIVGWYEQSCAKSSFFIFSSGEINWERKQKGKNKTYNIG